MRFYLTLIASMLFAASANAAVISKEVDYKIGSDTFKGTLAYDDAIKTPRPGIVLYPEWWGHNEYVKRRAAELAALGYVAFAADMYGDGKVTTDPKLATEWSKPLYDDRKLMRTRALAAVDALAAQANVDKANIVLTGFCFGGTNALELARAGIDVKGVAVFHAGLDFPDDVKNGAVKARVLVMNGGNDPHVKPEADDKFVADMQAAGADVEMDLYGGAQHAFTNPDSGKAGLPGVGYDEKAEKRSMAHLKAFLAEVFGG